MFLLNTLNNRYLPVNLIARERVSHLRSISLKHQKAITYEEIVSYSVSPKDNLSKLSFRVATFRFIFSKPFYWICNWKYMHIKYSNRIDSISNHQNKLHKITYDSIINKITGLTWKETSYCRFSVTQLWKCMKSNVSGRFQPRFLFTNRSYVHLNVNVFQNACFLENFVRELSPKRHQVRFQFSLRNLKKIR